MGIASNARASKYKLRSGSKRFTGEAGICNRLGKLLHNFPTSRAFLRTFSNLGSGYVQYNQCLRSFPVWPSNCPTPLKPSLGVVSRAVNLTTGKAVIAVC